MAKSVTTPARPVDRQDGILDAAFRTFAAYGFRRSTMDDIARMAGMSRSALYLHFRNKEDIFRSMAEGYFAETEAAVAAILAEDDGPAAEVLATAIAAKDGKFMELVLGTPHGLELLDAGMTLAQDPGLAWEARIASLLADWFRRRGLTAEVGTAEEVAGILFAALKGLKTASRNMADYRREQKMLALIFTRALGI